MLFVIVENLAFNARVLFAWCHAVFCIIRDCIHIINEEYVKLKMKEYLTKKCCRLLRLQ